MSAAALVTVRNALLAYVVITLLAGAAWADARGLAGARVGAIDSDNKSGAAIAELTLAWTERRKTQLDLAGGFVDDSAIVAVGIRLSRRLGERYRVGVTAAAAARMGGDSQTLARVGVEGEAFVFGRFVARAEAGYQAGDVRRNGYAQASGTLYLTEDLSLEVGGEFVSGDEDIVRARAEWRPRTFAAGRSSFHVDVAHDPGDNNSAVFVGLRYSFGGRPTSLLRMRRNGQRRGVLDPMVDFVVNPRGAH